MEYTFNIFVEGAAYFVTIWSVKTGDKITIKKIADTDDWMRELIVPASEKYEISIDGLDLIKLTAFKDDAINGELACDKSGLISYHSSACFKMEKPEPNKEQVIPVIDNTIGYYESRLLIDTIISKLVTKHDKADIIVNYSVTMEFLDNVEGILLIEMGCREYENVDKFALLKDVVKNYVVNYVVNKNNLQLRSLYFTGEYTIGKLFEMTGIPIEEFSSQIAMLIIYKELFGKFVE